MTFRMEKKFEQSGGIWRVSVPQLRLARAGRIWLAIGVAAFCALLFVFMFPLGFAVKAGDGRALELFCLFSLLLLLAGQHFIFRMIVPDQYKIADTVNFTETSKLFLVYWIAYIFVSSLILLKLGGRI